MRIKIITIGTLDKILQKSNEIIEGKEITIQSALELLVNKYGRQLAREMYRKGRINNNLSILVNGRNVLSMPYKYQTHLKDGDELIITEKITGG